MRVTKKDEEIEAEFGVKERNVCKSRISKACGRWLKRRTN